MKRKLHDLSIRVVVILLFVLFPLFAILALPWALFDSMDTWGHTTFDSWCEYWAMYRPASLKDAGRRLIAPLGSNV